MQKAKQAVSDFISHDGHHKTTVHEDVKKAVTEEQVRPQKHENITTAIDKEVHQDHHHTAIQPIQAKEVLPERHSHNVVPVEHKTVKHGDDRDVRAALEKDANKFKDKSVTHSTTHSVSTAPVVESEHIHHHVYEHVQPVIQKETIAPHVVHTTVPIHETHHAPAVHHGVTTLPVKTLDELSGNRGILEGHAATKVKEFEGCPTVDGKNIHSVGSHTGQGREHVGDQFNTTTKPPLDGSRDRHVKLQSSGRSGVQMDNEFGGYSNNTPRGTVRESTRGAADMTARSERDSGIRQNMDAQTTRISHPNTTTATTGLRESTNNGMSGNKSNKKHSHSDSAVDMGINDHGQNPAEPGVAKASWLDKLNPLKDADGDGKKGIFD
ncbi:hypothetical protein PT974_03123 [Cladobotryum mycophilum]|uniref:Allergen n=1 Tax=Cladobotryum mycophilum TaxID=491253 RepID=A0ABR0SSN8_9HYPO